MTLDVEPPDPPELRGPEGRGDYDAVDEIEGASDDPRREALAEFLHDGAWVEAFDRWRESADLTQAEWDLVIDHDLVERFDFYWNPRAEDVGYLAPDLPDELTTYERGGAEDVDEQAIEEELDDLGRTVSEVLENRYVDRTGEEFGFFQDR